MLGNPTEYPGMVKYFLCVHKYSSDLIRDLININELSGILFLKQHIFYTYIYWETPQTSVTSYIFYMIVKHIYRQKSYHKISFLKWVRFVGAS